jgi:hypothetical protein
MLLMLVVCHVHIALYTSRKSSALDPSSLSTLTADSNYTLVYLHADCPLMFEYPYIEYQSA